MPQSPLEPGVEETTVGNRVAAICILDNKLFVEMEQPAKNSTADEQTLLVATGNWLIGPI